MLNTKEFFQWLEGYIENMDRDIPTASEWIEIKRKMLKVDIKKASCTEILSHYILHDIPKRSEKKGESMTEIYGVFPEADGQLEEEQSYCNS